MDRPKVAIVSVVYHEAEWQKTRECVHACQVDTYFVERNPPGIGSLSEALNRGFRFMYEKVNPEYVWFVTNVTFSHKAFTELIQCTEIFPQAAAIHPCFESDHAHLRQRPDQVVSSVQFVEFAAPIVRADVFAKFPLDEKMPYVGMDMDWGFRVRQAGHAIGVYHGEKLGHAYNRHMKQEPITKKRARARANAVPATRRRLIQLYGKDYATKLGYKGPL